MKLEEEYLNQQQWRNWQQYLQHIPIRSDDLVVDLGCSVGGVAKLLSPMVGEVVGVDIDESFIAYCQSNARPNQQFICADIAQFDFHQIQKLSGVWSSYALSYLADPSRLLSTIFNTIEDGGWVALADVSCFISGNMSQQSRYYQAVKKFEMESVKSGNYDFNFGTKLIDLLLSAGFTIVYHDNNVSDRELNFDGAASPQIIKNWQARLSRLAGLQNHFSDDYHQVCSKIISNLTSHDHKKRGNVSFVVAKKI